MIIACTRMLDYLHSGAQSPSSISINHRSNRCIIDRLLLHTDLTSLHPIHPLLNHIITHTVKSTIHRTVLRFLLL